MTELQFTTDTCPIWKAILWVFYPMSVLVALELFLGATDGDDDDDDEGGGVMTPVYQGA